MSAEVRVFLFFLDDFDLLGKVLRIRIAVEVSIGGLSKPVGASSKLVREVSIVVFLGVLFMIFF